MKIIEKATNVVNVMKNAKVKTVEGAGKILSKTKETLNPKPLNRIVASGVSLNDYGRFINWGFATPLDNLSLIFLASSGSLVCMAISAGWNVYAGIVSFSLLAYFLLRNLFSRGKIYVKMLEKIKAMPKEIIVSYAYKFGIEYGYLMPSERDSVESYSFDGNVLKIVVEREDAFVTFAKSFEVFSDTESFNSIYSGDGFNESTFEVKIVKKP